MDNANTAKADAVTLLDLGASYALPLGFTDERSKGEICNTLVDEIEVLEDGMAHLVHQRTGLVIGSH